MSNPAQNREHLIEKIRHLPADRLSEVEDFVDFLNQRAQKAPKTNQPFNFPVISVGQWPEGLKITRDEMYDDNGR